MVFAPFTINKFSQYGVTPRPPWGSPLDIPLDGFGQTPVQPPPWVLQILKKKPGVCTSRHTDTRAHTCTCHASTLKRTHKRGGGGTCQIDKVQLGLHDLHHPPCLVLGGPLVIDLVHGVGPRGLASTHLLVGCDPPT